MIAKTVDLYRYFEQPGAENGAGTLTVLVPEIPEKLSSRRVRPAVLILPGGGYSHVSDREAESVALRFAAKGWAAFVLRYSCAPLGFPVSLREAAMAMRFIRENAGCFRVDPHMVAAMGFSAGGHLCGCLGTMYDSRWVLDLGTPELLRPDGLGLCYPVAVSWGRTHQGSFGCISGGDTELRQALSLEKLVRPDMPPVFLWHTRDDGSVPVRNSLILASALEEAGVDFSMHIYRHGKHGLATADELVYPVDGVPEMSWDVPGWLEAGIRFFNEIGLEMRDLEEDK